MENIISVLDTQYKGLAESITDIFFALDKSLNCTFWNQSSEIITGIPAESALGCSLYDLLPDIKDTPAEEAFHRVLETNKSERLINQFRLNNTDHFFELSIYPAKGGVSVIARDISGIYYESEHKKTAQERFRNTLDKMIEGCAIFSFDWKYLYANEVHKKHAHVTTTEEITGKSVFDMVPGFEGSVFYNGFKVSMEDRIPYQVTDCFTFPDGSTCWYESRSIPIPEGIFVLSIDITQRKKDEQNLKMYESILNQTEKMAHLGSWWIDFDEPGNIESSRLSWSEEVYRIFGYEPDSIKVTNELFFSHVPSEDREEIIKDIAKAISDCCPYDIEHRIIARDGKEKIIHEYANVIYNENNKPVRIIGAAHDITRIKYALQERDNLLLEVELEKEKLQTVIDTVPVEIWVFDKNKSLLFVNPAVKSGLGIDDTSSLTLESVLSNLDIRNLDGSKRTPEQSPVFRSLKGETVIGDEVVTHLKTGELRFRQFSSSPIKNKQGDIFGVVVVVNDITDHKKSEERILDLLRLSEQRTAELNAIFESMPDAVYIGSADGITHCNEKALKMLGAESVNDLRKRIGELGNKFNIRWPETGTPLVESELQFFRALHGETVAEEVLATNAENGENVYIRSACAPIRQNGNIIGAVAVNTDITGKKKAENQIKNSLKEKEVLLRELYHRTKNNMQVISSILGLKAASLDDKTTSDILEEMKNRILAIALVHQKLYQSHNLSRVDLKEYIIDLINLIESSYAIHENRVKMLLDLESITVVIDMAIPCGLIINELVSNSLKYAFPADSRGEVEIKLKRLSDGSVELVVADNGIGMTEKSLNEMSKLGLQLVRIIAEDQLQAETKVTGNGGIKWTFRFSDTLYDARI